MTEQRVDHPCRSQRWTQSRAPSPATSRRAEGRAGLRRVPSRVVSIAAIVIAASLAPPVSGAPMPVEFEMTELGHFGSEQTRPRGLNDLGQVVGESHDPTAGRWRAFKWDPVTGMQTLGVLVPDAGETSEAYAINNHGQVVGQSGQTSGSQFEAFLHDPDTGMIGLGTLDKDISRARDINDHGFIVGSLGIGHATRPFVYTIDDQTLAQLDYRSTTSYANGVNENNQAVGSVELGSQRSPFLYDLDTGDVVEVDQYEQWNFEAKDVNRAGMIVGEAVDGDGTRHAFTYTEEAGLDILGALPGQQRSIGNAVNDAGVVVGTSIDTTGGITGWQYHGFIYHETTGLVNLDDLVPTMPEGYRLHQAHDVNASGQVAAFLRDHQETSRVGVLLTPIAYQQRLNPGLIAQVDVTEDQEVLIDDDVTSVMTQYINWTGPEFSNPFYLDRRGMMQIDVSGIGYIEEIRHATLTLDPTTISSSEDEYPAVSVFGFGGSGELQAEDALDLSQLLGTSDPVTALDPFSIELDAAMLETLLVENDYLGLTVFGSGNEQQLGFHAVDSATGDAPQFELVYAVPEPVTAATMMGLLWMLTLRRCDRQRARPQR